MSMRKHAPFCIVLLYISIFRNMVLLNEVFLNFIIYARLDKNDTAPLFTLIHFVFRVYVARAHQKCYMLECGINI